MASLAQTNLFITKVFEVFTPSMVKLTYRCGDFHGTRSFNTTQEKGTKSLMKTIWRTPGRVLEVEEVQITTVAGTLREHSESYPRKPLHIVPFMGMKIDILPCNPHDLELQQVCLRQDNLTRMGSNIKSIDKEMLRGAWNENTECYRMPMPSARANIIQGQPKGNSISYRRRLRFPIGLDTSNGGAYELPPVGLF